MNLSELQNGDAVYAAVDIVNDGSVPDADEGHVFATAGTMGMLLNTGHLEENPNEILYLVTFKMENGEMGPPVTCLEDEITPIYAS